MVEVMVRAAARVSWTAVLAAACTMLFVLGVAGLAGARPGPGAARATRCERGVSVGDQARGHPRGGISVVVRVDDRGPLDGRVELGLSGAASEETG